MAISFDKALGIHQQAVAVREKRAEVLANNIANADTPNYKARDMDFKEILAGTQPLIQTPLKMSMTHDSHYADVINPDFAADLMYRTPMQPSVDDNTVEVQEEMARYTENALDYQASFDFLNRKFKGLSKALKGE